MNDKDKGLYGLALLRITIGALFLVMGIKKFQNPDMIIGMLGGLGFPAATALGWLLLLSEVVFGALILVGYKLKYTAWPLAIILAVALITVTIPNEGFASGSFYFHLISIAALVTLAFAGPGKFAFQEVKSS